MKNLRCRLLTLEQHITSLRILGTSVMYSFYGSNKCLWVVVRKFLLLYLLLMLELNYLILPRIFFLQLNMCFMCQISHSQSH